MDTEPKHCEICGVAYGWEPNPGRCEKCGKRACGACSDKCEACDRPTCFNCWDDDSARKVCKACAANLPPTCTHAEECGYCATATCTACWDREVQACRRCAAMGAGRCPACKQAAKVMDMCPRCDRYICRSCMLPFDETKRWPRSCMKCAQEGDAGP